MNNFLKIQLQPNSKKPVSRGWADGDEAKLNAMNVLCDTSKNYGVLCGKPNDIIVYDYDIHKLSTDKHSQYNLDALLHFHGKNCYIVKTPSGGFHVYHKLDETTENWGNIIGIDGFLDIKTTGGYVVGAGSTFGGKKYELLHQGETLEPLTGEYFDAINEKIKTRATGEKKDYKTDFDLDEVEELLEQVGFSSIKWLNGYEFDCDQRGRGTTCPICNQNHSSNHFYIKQNDLGAIFVRNFSNKCSTNKIKTAQFCFTDEETQLIQNEGYDEAYIELKRQFEKNVCFVEEAIAYVVMNDEDKVDVLTTKQLRERFMNLNYTDMSDGKYKSFVETWIRDKHRRFFKRIDFLPEKCPKTTFNLWRGYEVEKIIPDGTGTIEPFMELMKQLTENDYDYFEKWLAFLFQHPASKPITSPIFTSVQGTGKNSFFDLIGRIMGKSLYYETNDPENHLFGRFSGCIEQRKFLFLDEFESSTGFKHSARIKGIITNERHTIEPKGLKAYEVQNLLGIAFASNNSKPVNVENSDRRFFAYNPKKVLDHQFFKEWRDWVKQPQNQRAVYDYLMDIDLKDVDWENDRPKTQIYSELKYNSLPSIIKWLDYTITENFPAEWKRQSAVKSTTIYDNYKRFGHTMEKSPNQFGKAIRSLMEKEEMRGFKKAPRSSSGTQYIINREEVFDWLRQKGYTEATELEPEIKLEDEDYF